MKLIPGPHSAVAPPGTPGGDAVRDAFLSDLLNILGDTRLLWLPANGDTTTTTESSLNARVVTYDATIASRKGVSGSGVTVDFDGTDDEADTPDVANLSFGDAVVDEPFSLVVLCKPDVNNAVMTLLAKENSATAEEWGLEMNASGHLVLRLTDESASATIIGTYATAIGTGWVLCAATYDGTAQDTGIKVYTNGLRRTTAPTTSGTYVAMENTAALVHLGARYATKAQFFNGRIALAAVVAGQLTDHENWAIVKLVNSFFDLSL